MAATRSLDVGFGLFPYDRFRSVGEIIDVVQFGERLGYDVVSLTEHLLPPRWADRRPVNHTWYDPITLAAVLAGATRRIKFLWSVLVVPYHHPVRLAKSIATLDVASEGRIMCGVGSGWIKGEFKRLGIPYAERGAITDEYLRAMIELWTADAPVFHGKYVSFEDVDFHPKPLQQPYPPLLIGGTGPRPFQRAAEIGTGWIPMSGDLQWGISEIRRRMVALGRDPDTLWVGAGLRLGVDPDADRAAQHATSSSPHERRETEVLTSRDAIARRLEDYRNVGVRFVSLGFGWQDVEDMKAQLERFARDVIPLCRAEPTTPAQHETTSR